MALQGAHARSMSAPDGDRTPLDPKAILTSIGEVVYDWDLTTDVISWGTNAADVFGLRDVAPLASGAAFALAVEADRDGGRHDAIFAAGATDTGSGVPFRARYALRLSPDRALLVEDTGRWYADAEGRPAFAHGVVRIDRSGGHEEATFGARDRLGFLNRIRKDVQDTARSKRSVTLLVAAIDGLGHLNDDLGFEAADEVIAEVARRIRTVMRRRDHLVRYTGNRFAVALMSCPAGQVEVAARRLAHAVEGVPVATTRGPVMVRLRLGAATAPEHAAEAPSLLRRAESALARAKASAGTPFVLFDPAAVPERGRPRGTPALDIVQALNDRRIVLARQPVVDARSRVPAFSEALVRIRGEGGTVARAGDIMPAVERSGFAPLVDHRVLELAADYLVAHPQERLSINVSPLTIESMDWLGTLAAHLGARPGIESRLIVEITETAAVRDPQAVRSRLDAMKALGVAVAIDDFGAGHTSFKHLRGFPVDLLKIDGAFVQNLARSPDDRFFVRTLVDLAHHLGIATVAEWVEDEETARTLAEWGVDFLQGDHTGAPALVEDGTSESAAQAA